MRTKIFLTGLFLLIIGSLLFTKWQQVKAGYLGKADVPGISGYAISLKNSSNYPLYQTLGLTGLLMSFMGIFALLISGLSRN